MSPSADAAACSSVRERTPPDGASSKSRRDTYVVEYGPEEPERYLADLQNVLDEVQLRQRSEEPLAKEPAA